MLHAPLPDPDRMAVADLADRCGQETAKSRRGQSADDRFCFELFRRALVLRDSAAWEAILRQYGRLVQSWLNVRGPDAEALVNDAFARFWQQIPPDQFLHRFHHLGALLAYLRKCARSAAIAHWRQEKQQEKLETLLRDRHKDSSERDPLLDFDAPELAAHVKARLDEREWRVIELSIIYGLKPRQIHAQHPNEFISPHEVSHIKERGLERLRRDSYLRRLWDVGLE